MIEMDQYELIRIMSRSYKKGIRQIAKETGHHRKTVRKALAGKAPEYRRKKPVAHPVMGPYESFVEEWLTADKEIHKCICLYLVDLFYLSYCCIIFLGCS